MKKPKLNIMDADKLMAFWGGDAERKPVVLTDPKNELTRQGVTFDGFIMNPSADKLERIIENSLTKSELSENPLGEELKKLAEEFDSICRNDKDQNLFWRRQSEELIEKGMKDELFNAD